MRERTELVVQEFSTAGHGHDVVAHAMAGEIGSLRERLREFEAQLAGSKTDLCMRFRRIQELEGVVADLERWKREAVEVLGEWDALWEAMGRPGPLGGSKAASCSERVAYRQRLLNELSQAIRHRSTEQIRKKYSGNTPEDICGEADELTALFQEFGELKRERDEARGQRDELKREVERVHAIIYSPDTPEHRIATLESRCRDLEGALGELKTFCKRVFLPAMEGRDVWTTDEIVFAGIVKSVDTLLAAQPGEPDIMQGRAERRSPYSSEDPRQSGFAHPTGGRDDA